MCSYVGDGCALGKDPKTLVTPEPIAPVQLEIPLNGKTLAAKLGRSPGYIAAMKAGGYRFSHGTRTLLSDALKWLAQHPDFRVTGYRNNAPGFAKRKK